MDTTTNVGLYITVDDALPQTLPPITMKEALRYYKKLVRAFGGVRFQPVREFWPYNVPIRSKRRKGRRCWASVKPSSGHHKGWGRMIHDASHYVFSRRHPSFKPHAGGHATLEREMAQYVVKKGWV